MRMGEKKRETKTKARPDTVASNLNAVAARSVDSKATSKKTSLTKKGADKPSAAAAKRIPKKGSKEVDVSAYDSLFEKWDETEFAPTDYMVNVPIDSLESAVGYSSLFRQMHQSFVRHVAYYKSPSGGSLSTEEARARAFHASADKEEAKKEFGILMGLPLETLNFIDLLKLHSSAPRVAENFWEHVKSEAEKEFLSGHLSANISFPVGYMKQVWNIGRYLAVRESFITDWTPQGGIEFSLIDMLTQSYFQWQFWIEQTVRRSQT